MEIRFITVIAEAYNYWAECDRGGWYSIIKNFTTKEKAEKFVAENPYFGYKGWKEDEIPTDEYYKTKFKITETKIEIE